MSLGYRLRDLPVSYGLYNPFGLYVILFLSLLPYLLSELRWPKRYLQTISLTNIMKEISSYMKLPWDNVFAYHYSLVSGIQDWLKESHRNHILKGKEREKELRNKDLLKPVPTVNTS